MKETLKKKLIKDILLFAIPAVIVIAILIAGFASGNEELLSIFEGESVFVSVIAVILVPIIGGFEVAGFILGWKWVSDWLKAYNLLGFIIKGLIATFAGYIIYPIVLIKDIIAYKKA